jgi:hypothetical protein
MLESLNVSFADPLEEGNDVHPRLTTLAPLAEVWKMGALSHLRVSVTSIVLNTIAWECVSYPFTRPASHVPMYLYVLQELDLSYQFNLGNRALKVPRTAGTRLC